MGTSRFGVLYTTESWRQKSGIEIPGVIDGSASVTGVRFTRSLVRAQALVAADNTPSLQNPAAVDDEIDAVDALVVEQEFHGVHNILGRRESAAGCTRAHRR